MDFIFNKNIVYFNQDYQLLFLFIIKILMLINNLYNHVSNVKLLNYLELLNFMKLLIKILVIFVYFHNIISIPHYI